MELVRKVDAITRAGGPGRETWTQVIAPENDFWPLPWYLPQAEWLDKLPANPSAPLMIVSKTFEAQFDETKTCVMAGIFELRPQVFFELYVRTNLWRAYLDAAAKTKTTTSKQ